VNVGSLFSGVGGFDLGLERAGHSIVGQVEWDEKCQAILRKHWPEVPLYGDISTLDAEWLTSVGILGRDGSKGEEYRVSGGSVTDPDDSRRGQPSPDGVDLVCGGFPCQDLSVAGGRAGLAGERSGLFFEAARISDLVLREGGWVLIENVPGLLSSNGGRDFGIVLASLAELGFYDLAWRVLDSQYFGVAQRRRRVFILARRARGRCAAEVLCEPEGDVRGFEPSGETRQEAPESLGVSVDGSVEAERHTPSANSNGVRTAPGVSGWLDPSVTCAYDPKPDGTRYSQMGNAVTVNVAEWIGHRLARLA
jgi:DNA (cytosine-5)-methyltransferase 1